MTLKTRLVATFLTMIFLPVLLILIAFLGFGFMLSSVQEDVDLNRLDMQRMESIQSAAEEIEVLYNQVSLDLEADANIFEQNEYIDTISQEAQKISAYVLIRKGNKVFYSGNESAGNIIFNRLPKYNNLTSTESSGYYYQDLQKYVRQLDFRFSDGSQGSFFIIEKISNVISKTFIVDMFFAIVIILFFTSYFLTRGIHRGVFTPIRELNRAMQNIAEGNLDYQIITNTEGEIGSLYHNYEDMRIRLKQSAEGKVESDRQNRELISNISHDLKTPITAIKGYVEGIIDGVADTPEKVDKYIRTVYSKSNDMDRLIDELTLYSGIDANRIPYNFHRINVKEYFSDCIEEVGLDLEQRNITLNYSNLTAPDTIIIADPEQMKRVINNIVGNSIKYMDKPKGIIEIRILDVIDSVRVEIDDNGKGIAAKDLVRVFERFYRTDASRNSLKGGSGIGLSIVKKIIEDHGGYIWATSKEGEGTCVHFVIRKYREGNENE